MRAMQNGSVRFFEINGSKKLINIVTCYRVISLFFYLIHIFTLHCQLFLLISGSTTYVTEKSRPNVKFSLYLKKAGLASRNIVHLQKIILRCIDFCFYFLQDSLSFLQDKEDDSIAKQSLQISLDLYISGQNSFYSDLMKMSEYFNFYDFKNNC